MDEADVLHSQIAHRLPIVVWRGGMTGRPGHDIHLRSEGDRLNRIIADVEQGKRRIAKAMACHPMADVSFIERPPLHPLYNALRQSLGVPLDRGARP